MADSVLDCIVADVRRRLEATPEDPALAAAAEAADGRSVKPSPGRNRQ